MRQAAEQPQQSAGGHSMITGVMLFSQMLRAVHFRSVLMLGCVLTLTYGCATRGPARPPGASADEPVMTWELRTGGGFGDADVVCGSARPSLPCTLTASTEKTRSTVSISLFVYPAKELTNYAGFIRLPFVQGWSRLNARDVSGSIPGASRPVQTSVVGLVTTEPGEYTLAISLDTVYGADRRTNHLAVSVPVIVK